MNIKTGIYLLLCLLLDTRVGFSQSALQTPAARWTAQMTYDPNGKRALLFGGASKEGLMNDLWSWDGKRWLKLAFGGKVPARNKAVFAFDPNRNVAVLFGGQSTSGDNAGDTWEWDGTSWKEVTISGPAPRVHAMGTYDEKNKQLIIFGGFGARGMLRDTWAYDGESWRLIDEDGPGALAHGIFYDHKNERVVMITAEQKLDVNPKYMNNQSWIWTGTSWKPAGWPELKTSSSGLQALTHDGRHLIVYDGDDVYDSKGKTWIFRDGKWSGSYLPGPGMRVGHAMIYDRKRKQVLLFGGGDRKNYFSDTWTWDGEKWGQAATH